MSRVGVKRVAVGQGGIAREPVTLTHKNGKREKEKNDQEGDSEISVTSLLVTGSGSGHHCPLCLDRLNQSARKGLGVVAKFPYP